MAAIAGSSVPLLSFFFEVPAPPPTIDSSSARLSAERTPVIQWKGSPPTSSPQPRDRDRIRSTRPFSTRNNTRTLHPGVPFPIASIEL